jgi:2,4-dienoyl-CoA reductase-like NADH-dependent reductase (Old Yellow Enzyme family)
VNNGGGIVSSSDYQKNAGTEKAVSARALTAEEIHGLQRDFISAAMRAKQAGFNGVELHCAHGYIGSQFFSPMINKREDAYGGNIINRARFASEIISGIRKAAGDDFIISCRTGCNDPDLSGSIGIAKELEKSGVDMLNVSFGMVTPFDMKHETPPQVPDGFDYNWIVYGGTQVKKNVGIPTAVVFDIKTPVQAAYLVENGLADFTAILRGQLVDDNWVEKARTGKEVIPCLNCRICRWYVSGSRCPGRKKVQAL